MNILIWQNLKFVFIIKNPFLFKLLNIKSNIYIKFKNFFFNGFQWTRESDRGKFKPFQDFLNFLINIGIGEIFPAVFPYVEKEEEVIQNQVPSGPKDLTRKVVVSLYAKPAEKLNIMEIKTLKNYVCLSFQLTLAPVFDTCYRPFEDGQNAEIHRGRIRVITVAKPRLLQRHKVETSKRRQTTKARQRAVWHTANKDQYGSDIDRTHEWGGRTVLD